MKTLLRRIFGTSKDERVESEASAELEQAISPSLDQQHATQPPAGDGSDAVPETEPGHEQGATSAAPPTKRAGARKAGGATGKSGARAPAAKAGARKTGAAAAKPTKATGKATGGANKTAATGGANKTAKGTAKTKAAGTAKKAKKAGGKSSSREATPSTAKGEE